MASLYHSLFTEKGLELLRTAIQTGTKLGITHMSFGDGNGILPTPDAKFTQMVKEVYRVQLNRLAQSKENANWLEADGVIPSAIGGFNIREVGLWAGDVMVAYANYPPTYKPSGDQGTAQIKTIRIVLQIDNTANFELKIDASVVMATIQSLQEAKSEVIDYTDKTKIHIIDNIKDLNEQTGLWENRTVYVKGSGIYTYKNGKWEIENEYTFARKGDFKKGVILNSIQDVVIYNKMHYFYKGQFPYTINEDIPNDSFQCVGLLNSYSLNHTRNWNIVDDGTDQTSKVLFALINAPVDNLTSDGELVRISNLNITTNYKINVLNFSKIKFAPYFSAPVVSLDYLIKINHSKTDWQDIIIDTPPVGKKVEAVFKIVESIRHLFKRINLSSTDTFFNTVFDMGLVKESGFTDLRIDLDAKNKTGTVFKSQSCVNNWVTGGMYGYGQYFIDCDPTPYSNVAYKSEGWVITNLIAVHFENPLKAPWVTAIQVTNCIFDFCKKAFFEFTNGAHSMITNCWFANQEESSATDAFAIVSGSNYDGITIANNVFLNNNKNNSTPLFSINPSINGNSCIFGNRSDGFIEGVILSSDTFSNSFVNKNLNIQSTNTSKHKIQGVETTFENINKFQSNSVIHSLLFKSSTSFARIFSEMGDYSDLTRLNFSIAVAGIEKTQLSLYDNKFMLPVLPTTAASAGVNGLYAGADGVLKINRP